MFLEKDRRYFRRFALTLKQRVKAAPALPLVGPDKEWNALDALRRAIRNGKASVPQSGGETVDLIAAEHLADKELLVLLFHRANPNAADPAYRKRLKSGLSLRHATKETNEEQAVSCHLVISTKLKDGVYQAALEEIPGLSATSIIAIISRVLMAYKYPYISKGKSLETTAIFRLEGLKSATLEDALKKEGSLDYLTLTRRVPTSVPDSSGIAEPQAERVRYKIVGDPSSKKWGKKFKEFVEGTKGTWDHVTVDLTLSDNRHKTIRVDTEQEAAEILFVRSELVMIPGQSLRSCSTAIVQTVVDAARKLVQ